MKKEFDNLPISKTVRKLVNEKRLTLMHTRNKSLTLTEVVDEIVLKGLPLVE